MKKYSHLFFDIDSTLWDYETNMREVLAEMHQKYNLIALSIPLDGFIREFYKYNELLWLKYRHGKIQKEELRDRRFYLTLKKLGVKDNELTKKLSIDYIELCPNKTNLFPDVIETLEVLQAKKYHMHIITNGFNEVQFRKLKNSGIEHFFQKVITSDSSGYQKPHQKIFEMAITSVRAKKDESLMIGDDWNADIVGAKKYGIDQVFFNPTQKSILYATFKATYEIINLKDLLVFL
jgi:putative hydrolase of the HAD superfamily